MWVRHRDEIVDLLRDILKVMAPEQIQQRWHKGVASVLYTYAIFHKIANVECDLKDAIELMGMSTAKRNVLKVAGRSFWDRLECEIRLHMEKQEKPPLTWLNPCSSVCIDGNYESAISIRVSDIHEFTSISNKETKENISNSIGNPKHLSDTVAFAMNEIATLSQVRRRVKELVRNAKAYKIPKRILGKDLCNAIEYACGLIEDIPANSDEAEINDDEQNMCKLPENKMEELRLLLGNIDASVGNTLQDPMHDDLDQRLPIDELSPNTKFMYDLRSPKGKRNYEKGLIDGLRIAKQRQRQDDEQRVSECDDTSSTPSCSTAVDTDVKRPRRQLKFAAGTIGVVNKECNSVKNNADTDTVDDLCALCHRKWPPNMKGKTASWVQCNSCKKWFHLLCLRMKRKELLQDIWHCDDCEAETPNLVD